MSIESREDFVDIVAQAVIDRIEERYRINAIVEQVVMRVIEIQKKEAAAKAQLETQAPAQQEAMQQ